VPRCLGHELIVSVDLLSMDLRPDDVVVQCTDGIHAALAEADIKELLEAHPPQAACRALVRRARAADDADDASVQIAAVGAVAAPARRPWWRLGL
jgi:serine/threonine protein phosphatase PrpC